MDYKFVALDGQRYRYVSPPGKLAEGRPRRKRYSLSDVEDFHGIKAGTCARCGQLCQAEKCHLVDFAWGGPDTLENIVPLCSLCHRRGGPDDTRMPIFVPGEEWKTELYLESETWGEYVTFVGMRLLTEPEKCGAVKL
jgi:5-methylcytosine-specific restriction endonuclease McrA